MFDQLAWSFRAIRNPPDVRRLSAVESAVFHRDTRSKPSNDPSIPPPLFLRIHRRRNLLGNLPRNDSARWRGSKNYVFLSRGRTLANHGLAPSNFYCRVEYLMGEGDTVKLKSRSPALPIIRVVRREAIVLDTERLTPDERRHRTVPRPHHTPHTLAAVFNHPGVPNHYLTFITSYERRNLSWGRQIFARYHGPS